MTLHSALSTLMQRGWWIILSKDGVLLRRDYTRTGEDKRYESVSDLVLSEIDRDPWTPDSYDEVICDAVSRGWHVGCGPDRASRRGEIIVSITNRDGKHKSERVDSTDVMCESKSIAIVVRKMLR